MKTLHLNLKKKWFDMILSGEKKEEYRDTSKYWIQRIYDFFISEVICEAKDFETITFSNGYAKNRKQFVVELYTISIGKGRGDWGAEKGKEYITFELGEIISSNFSNN